MVGDSKGDLVCVEGKAFLPEKFHWRAMCW